MSPPQIQKKWDGTEKVDPEKQPSLEENHLKPSEGEAVVYLTWCS